MIGRPTRNWCVTRCPDSDVTRASRRAASTFVSTFDFRFRVSVCASQDIDTTRLVEEVGSVERVALLGDEACVADQAAEFFF
jgi:hypothetical protein